MALSCNWPTKVITIPQSDLTLVSGTYYTLDVTYYFQLLRELNGSAEGISQTIGFPLYNNTSPVGVNPRIVDVINGYTIQIEDNLISVDLINGNTNWRSVEIRNNVSVGTNNVAALINPTFLEAGLFAKGVVIKASGTPGVGYDTDGAIIGTEIRPSSNDIDAGLISNIRGVSEFYMVGTNVLTGDHSGAFRFVGAGAQKSITILTSGTGVADVTDCTFINQVLTGTGSPGLTIQDSIVSNMSESTGIIKETGLKGTLTLGAGTTSMSDCSAISPGIVLDATVVGSIVHGDGMRGTYTITNKTGAEEFNLATASGHLVIDSTCTGGIIHITGFAEVTDNSGVGCDVQDHTESKKILDIHKASYNRRKHDDVANTITLYEDDKVTPHTVFDADDALTDISPQ